MKTISEYAELAIPDYALSYLVNGDDSGIDEQDKLAADAFMQQFDDEATKEGGSVIFACGEGEGSFTHYPEFGLACNCIDCTVLIVK